MRSPLLDFIAFHDRTFTPGVVGPLTSKSDDPGRFFEDFCNWQRIPEFKEIALESRAADVAAVLMGSREVRLFHDHVLVKEPGTVQQTPWHQDQPYYNVDGFDNCSMWMPVDPVAAESTLEFLAGSHLGGWLMPRSFLASQAKWFPEGSLIGARHEAPSTRGPLDIDSAEAESLGVVRLSRRVRRIVARPRAGAPEVGRNSPFPG